jgi:pimeloyl-ACP methyl ester carboxylesterase
VLQVDGNELSFHLSTGESGQKKSRHGLVLSHGFPAQRSLSLAFGETYPSLADRLAVDTGWHVLAFDFRGTGQSTGDFSLAGWLRDLHGAVEFMRQQPEIDSVSVAGLEPVVRWQLSPRRKTKKLLESWPSAPPHILKIGLRTHSDV